MAFIRYKTNAELDPGERAPDPDNIIQIHALHPAVMHQHLALYREIMHQPGPLSRREREVLALRVSSLNQCRY